MRPGAPQAGPGRGFGAAAAGGAGGQEIDAGAGEAGIWVRRDSQSAVKSAVNLAGRIFAEVRTKRVISCESADFVGRGEEFELVQGEGCAFEPDGGALVELARKASAARQRMGAAMGHWVMGRKVGIADSGSRSRFGRDEVAGAELAVDFGEGEADAVAVGERRRGVELESGG